jgi:FKBP-type peptidyl-prolyl cis-trans isomerase FkpA
MIKRVVIVALLCAAVSGFTSCSSNSGFKKMSGIEYKIVKDKPGKKAAIGDIIEFNFKVSADTPLFDSRTQGGGKPVARKVQALESRGNWESVFTKLSAGDSAVVRVSVDTIMAVAPTQKLPPTFKPHHFITFEISVVSVKSVDEYRKELEAQKAEQAQIDDGILQKVFAQNNLHPQKTPSGLYYTIDQDGTGDVIGTGKTVSVYYTGRTLQGKEFDSNVDTSFHHTDPLTFKTGDGQMIPGMSEGVALLKKGSKATLFIPSTLAYGPQPGPDNQPNAILIFNVSVADVK